MLGANRFFVAVGGRDFDAMIRQQAAVTLQSRNAVSLKERGDAAGQLLHDAGFARLHRGNIYTELSHADAVAIELRLGPMVKLRRLQKRFRRNTARVQTSPAERATAIMVLPLVDTRSVQTILRRTDGRRIARRAAADHDDIEFSFTHIFRYTCKISRAGSSNSSFNATKN